MSHKPIYFLLLVGLFFLLVSSLGSGLWGAAADYSSWPYRMFHGICHQIPERSFFLNDVPMAVNARCFGIFLGLAVAWLLMPAIGRLVTPNRWQSSLLGVAVLLQIFDYMGSLFGLWSSTNQTRFLAGAFLGVTVVLVLIDLFYKRPESQKQS